MAIGVRVYIRIHTEMFFAPTTKSPQRVFTVKDWVEAKGASTITNGSTESYKFDGLYSDLAPIRAEWKLITGKRKKGIWFYKSGDDSKFLTKEGIEKIAYYRCRAYESVKSPYFRMQRKYYFRKSKSE